MLHRTLRSLMVAVVATASIGALATATATAETEYQSTWGKTYDRWNDPDDYGGQSISEAATKHATGEYVSASFQAYGEILQINDRHRNDRSAIAKLWVGGSGPAIYYGNGDNTSRKVNLSYAEGQRVYLQVCTSDSPNAVCTGKEKYVGNS